MIIVVKWSQKIILYAICLRCADPPQKKLLVIHIMAIFKKC